MRERENRLELEILELRAQIRSFEERLIVSDMVCPMCGAKVTK